MRASQIALLVAGASVLIGIVAAGIHFAGSEPDPGPGTARKEPKKRRPLKDDPQDPLAPGPADAPREDPPPVAPVPAPPVEPSPVPSAPMVAVEGFEDFLARLDWAGVSRNARPLTRDLLALGAAIDRQDQLPNERAASMSEHFTAYTNYAGLLEVGLPGSSPGSLMTHPAIAANAMAATLYADRQPLSQDQLKRLAAIAEKYAAQDRERVAALEDPVFHLTRLIGEAELRKRFFDEARGVLTVPQREFLSPSRVRDRVGLDLFSAAFVFAGVLEPALFVDPESLAIQFGDRVVGECLAHELYDPRREEIMEWLKAWSQALPGGYQTVAGRLDAHGHVELDRALDAAQRNLDVIQGLSERLAFESMHLTRARLFRQVLFPVKAGE